VKKDPSAIMLTENMIFNKLLILDKKEDNNKVDSREEEDNNKDNNKEVSLDRIKCEENLCR
jgi:hypothetical protein